MIKFAEDINDDTNDNQEAELQRLEAEKKGDNVQHDNLYRQCMEHERKCTNLERELKEIG